MRISDWSSDVCSSDLQILNTIVGAWDDDPAPFELPAEGDVRQKIAGIFREQVRPALGDQVDHYCDAEMLDVVQCNLFPNFGPFSSPTMSLVYNFRPHGSDPFKSVMEVMLLRSEEHTSELQSLMRISYAVFCLKK